MEAAWVALLLVFCHFTTAQIEGADCATSEPVEGQECISIKLPWNKDPVYLCAERTFPIRHCSIPENQRYCWTPLSGSYMTVNASWMCCPQISETDRCAEVQCPAQPFNRTCKEINHPGSCCPTFYCGTGQDWRECQKNKTCPQQPSDKAKRCRSFYDQHDCCPKFQCPGDKGSKEGRCPRGAWAPATIEGTNPNGSRTFHTCVGDHTCPDEQKCCQKHPSSVGYCVQPTPGEE